MDICFDLQTFLERTCRSCSRYFSEDINYSDFHRIFRIGEEQPSEEIKDIFDELTIWKLNIKPNDGLPQQVCNDCYKRFLSVKSFREECLDTQKVLESYFKDFEHLIENASQGRISPKADSLKSEPNDVVTAAQLPPSSPLDGGSPKLSLGSPKYDLVYAESSMGTPPPLFEEIKTEPIDMETLEYIKTEAELQSEMMKIKNDTENQLIEPINKQNQRKQNKKTQKSKVGGGHFTSSDDESSTPTSDEEVSSDDDDNEEEDIDAITDNNDEQALKKRRIKLENNFNYDPRNPLQCRICFAAFGKRSMLREHRLRAHPQEKPFVCNICGSAFKSNFLLRQHQLKHNRPDTIKCDLCSKYFRSQLHLQRHAKNFHLTSTYTCHICHEKFENYTQIRFQYHVRQHGEKRFNCQFCEKSFHQKIHLINHERTHSKEQPFSCDICGKAYRQQTACQEHMLTHKDPTPFKCKICQKGFTQRSSLRLHLRTHDSDKEQQQEQQRHQQCYQCKFCGQNFKQKIHFEVHQMSHMQQTHNKLRKCAYCGETYPNEMLLKSHLKTHAQLLCCFKCEYCGKTFPKQQTLLLHEKQHEQKKLLYLASMDRQHSMPSTLDDSDNFDDL